MSTVKVVFGGIRVKQAVKSNNLKSNQIKWVKESRHFVQYRTFYCIVPLKKFVMESSADIFYCHPDKSKINSQSLSFMEFGPMLQNKGQKRQRSMCTSRRLTIIHNLKTS